MPPIDVPGVKQEQRDAPQGQDQAEKQELSIQEEALQQQQEQQQQGVSRATTAAPATKTTTPMAQQPASQPKTEERKKIESILAEGLTQMYQSMTPEEQARFRTEGETTATAIEEMLRTFKATAHRVLELIRKWLATIPRVNNFFLEQESKLKTDEIIQLQRDAKKQRNATHIHTE